MDRVSSLMVRASLTWLLSGVVLGGLMLTDRAVPGDWRVWVMPTHGHMLFVGWLAQFALGVAYWLLPRRRTPGRPLGYDDRAALVAAAVLNLGLLLRVVDEPAERTGHDPAWAGGLLAASAVLQIVAIGIFVAQLWPRVGPRPARARRQEEYSP